MPKSERSCSQVDRIHKALYLEGCAVLSRILTGYLPNESTCCYKSRSFIHVFKTGSNQTLPYSTLLNFNDL